MNKSYIYSGTIRHRRFTPFDHFFTYPLFMAYLDLDSIDSAFKRSWLWNINGPALVSFMRKDYHGDEKVSLDESVRQTVFEKVGYKVKGPIRLLTHLRYLGYCFNPVSFYYCFDETDSEVDVIMAEVTNTPWDERHAYIIDERDKDGKVRNLIANFEKKLHVSPFWGMDHKYEWLFTQPDEYLMVNMKNFKDGDKVFDATLNMKRLPFTLTGILKQVARFPFITMVVVFRIHWQAFKLWVKRAPYFIHPDKANLKKGN
ncbi:MAG: DUF1365 domain-containing protein [Candidatus Marinimicrobia bacterium]|nr:DUF1365 domain-containing protein [Candidatus Neomarinimicrobiota bacterium]